MIAILCDQNVPRRAARWLAAARPDWAVYHTADLRFQRATDSDIAAWASARHAVLITYDEDFADVRLFPPGSHYGLVRLRVEPTTAAATIAALERLLAQIDESDLAGSTCIVDSAAIRERPH